MQKVVKECNSKTTVTYHKASDWTAKISEAILALQKIGVN
jgi:copper homeostasis protein CutC